MKVYINGEEYIFKKSKNIKEIVEEFKLDNTPVAVEYNKKIIKKNTWEKTLISDGDKIEIVHFIGGG